MEYWFSSPSLQYPCPPVVMSSLSAPFDDAQGNRHMRLFRPATMETLDGGKYVAG